MLNILVIALLQAAGIISNLPANHVSAPAQAPSAICVDGGSSGWTGDIALDGGSSGWTGDIALEGGSSGWTGDIA